MKFTLKLSSLLFLLSTLTLAAHGSTYTAASCEESDVNAVIHGPIHTAVNGDVIQIPAGTCSWTSTLNITGVGITIQGAGAPNNTPSTFGPGTTNTIIQGTGLGTGRDLISVTGLTSGQFMRISLLTLKTDYSGGAELSGRAINISGRCTSSGCANIRVDNIVFDPSFDNGVPQFAINMTDNVFGVFDHNKITGPGSITGNYLVSGNQSSWLGVGDWGDNSWASPDTMGTGQAIYIENNAFDNAQSDDSDVSGGGRFVCRFNHYVNIPTSAATCGGHGTDSTGRARGVRQLEVYGNTFTGDPSTPNNYSVIGMNSGVGLIFGNTFNFNSLSTYISLTARRNGTSFDPWGECTGSNGWDLNSGGSPVACLDQPGRGQGTLLISGCGSTCGPTSPSTPTWPNEALVPIYEWMDRQTGGFGGPVYGQSPNIIQNRDYYHENTNQSAQSSPSSPFDGSLNIGVGHGTLADRPTTCTTGAGYFASDQGSWNASGNGFGQGQLFKCASTNSWTLAYTPYTYPHPLISGSTSVSGGTPAAPANLVATVK
jgi:hypothetical protein